MKKNIIIYVFILITVFAIWVYSQYQKALDYDYKIKDISFDVIGLRNTSGKLVFAITNNSALSGNFVSSNLKMFINGVFVSDLATIQNIKIRPNSVFNIPLSFQFEPHRILSIKNLFALENIANPDKTMIAFKGFITVKKSLFQVEIPIDINEPYSWYI